jgi:D-inositol-3-phosphate glycosyltransferase
MTDRLVTPLRIALISEHASPAALLGGEDAGGQNVYVDELSRALGRMGHHVDVFTRRDAEDGPVVLQWAPGVRIVNLTAGPARPVRKDDLWPLMPAFLDELVRFALRDGARYDVAHGNFWMSGWVASRLRRALGIPAVQLFHALGVTKRRHQGDADTSPPDRIATERAIVRTVDRVIASCPHEVDELVAEYGTAPARIEMIPLGVDCATFQPVERELARLRTGLPLGIDDPVVTYVGRILPRKDVRNVIHALAHLGRIDPDHGGRAKLVVVGGESREPNPAVTPELGELQRLAAELGVADRVFFTGKRSKEELRLYYGAGDVAVTTPWYEPFGLTPLEAMACGRPVIGANVGGIAFTVAHGETGLLVPPREPEALAGAIAGLLGDPRRFRTMGRAARKRVEQSFTWPVVAARTAALYDDVIRQAKRLDRPGYRLPDNAGADVSDYADDAVAAGD